MAVCKGRIAVMQKLTLAAVAMLASAAAYAQQTDTDELATDAEVLEAEEELRRYTVELIVFAYSEDVATGSEVFVPELVEALPEEPVLLDEDGQPYEGPLEDDSVAMADSADENDPAADAAAADEAAEGEVADAGSSEGEELEGGLEGEELEEEEDPFQWVLLTAEELTMLDTYDRLDELDVYEPLLHVGWTQTALPPEETPPLTLPELGAEVIGLDGSFTLYLSRYLHLVVELALDAERESDEEDTATTPDVVVTDPVADTAADLSYDETALRYGQEYDPFSDEPRMVFAPLRYTISENRIVKSGDLRYYDHPRFGVVARVERYEAPEPSKFDDTDVLLPATE